MLREGRALAGLAPAQAGSVITHLLGQFLGLGGGLPRDQKKPQFFEVSLLLNLPGLGREGILGIQSPQSL